MHRNFMSDVRFIFLTHISINDIRYDFHGTNVQKNIITFDSFFAKCCTNYILTRVGIVK